MRRGSRSALQSNHSAREMIASAVPQQLLRPQEKILHRVGFHMKYSMMKEYCLKTTCVSRKMHRITRNVNLD